MPASRGQTRSQGPMPLEDDPNNNESDSVNHESEEEPAWAKERLPSSREEQ
jgi:hypothetical protein